MAISYFFSSVDEIKNFKEKKNMAMYANVGGASKLLAQTSSEGGGSTWEDIYNYSWTSSFAAPLNISCNLTEWQSVKILAKNIKTSYPYSGANPRIYFANSSKQSISASFFDYGYTEKNGYNDYSLEFPVSQSNGDSYYSATFVVDINVFGNYYALCQAWGSGNGNSESVWCGEVSNVRYIQLSTMYSATILGGGSIYVVGLKK